MLYPPTRSVLTWWVRAGTKPDNNLTKEMVSQVFQSTDRALPFKDRMASSFEICNM